MKGQSWGVTARQRVMVQWLMARQSMVQCLSLVKSRDEPTHRTTDIFWSEMIINTDIKKYAPISNWL